MEQPQKNSSTPLTVVTVLGKIDEGEQLDDTDVSLLVSQVFKSVILKRREWIAQSQFCKSGHTSFDDLRDMALSEIWTRLTEQQAWRGAMKAALQHSQNNEDAAEKMAVAYLRSCADHVLTSWCGERSLARELNRRVREVMNSSDFLADDKNKSLKVAYELPDRFDTTCDTEIPVSALCESVHFPPPKGTCQNLSIPLPTKSQILNVLNQVFVKHNTALTLQQAVGIVQYGWTLKEPEQLNGIENHDGDAGDPFETIGSPATYPCLQLEDMMQVVIDRIEDVDGTSLDPPPESAKQGKLGRLFLEYFLWWKWPIKGFASERYVIEVYQKHTGFGKTSENDRFNKTLVPLLRRVAEDFDLSLNELANLVFMFREKFLHRKPEFVEHDDL